GGQGRAVRGEGSGGEQGLLGGRAAGGASPPPSLAGGQACKATTNEAKHELLQAVRRRAGRPGETAQDRSRLHRPRRDRAGRAGGDEEVVQAAPQASGGAVQRKTALRADRLAGARHGGEGRRNQSRPPDTED